MPSNQGNPNRLKEDKILFGLSTSLNVESENESTNDYRAGAEFAMLKKPSLSGSGALLYERWFHQTTENR